MTAIPIYPKRVCFVRVCHTYKRVIGKPIKFAINQKQ
jgi:hypothetical protein